MTRLYKFLLIGIIVVATAFSLLFVGRGIYLLGLSPTKPNDLALRWREQQYIKKGDNPYDISDHLYKKKHGLQDSDKPVEIDENLGGTSIASGYPPWAFFWSNLFIPPIDWAYSRIWFFLTNIAALGVIAVYAWRAVGRSNAFHKLLAATTALSVNAIGTTLGNGQWGVVLCGLLILFLSFSSSDRKFPPAILYAIALLKPTFSFTHVTVMFARKQWVMFLVSGILTATASALIGWHTGTNPVSMVLQMLEQTARWHDVSYSIPDALVSLGLPRSATMLSCLGAAVAISWFLVRINPSDNIFGLAVCGTVARVFSYHQLYDNVMIIFLVIAVVRSFLNQPGLTGVIFLSGTLLSVWIPGRFTNLLPVQIFQIAIWIAALGWLCYLQKQSSSHLRPEEVDGLPSSAPH